MELKSRLPDFYSVRNKEQIDYSFEGMDGRRCYCFFDNGFASNVIEPNKRDIKFLWDGFILFVDSSVSLVDIRNGADLYDARLVALQRTSVKGDKANGIDVRNYILALLNSKGISYEVMDDTKEVSGYPSQCDLWSTRDTSVLLDAIDCVGDGKAFYVKGVPFKYDITFNKSSLPTLSYNHEGAMVLHGENSTAIARLICNDQSLQDELEGIIGSERLYSFLEGRSLSGRPIEEVKNRIKK